MKKVFVGFLFPELRGLLYFQRGLSSLCHHNSLTASGVCSSSLLTRYFCLTKGISSLWNCIQDRYLYESFDRSYLNIKFDNYFLKQVPYIHILYYQDFHQNIRYPIVSSTGLFRHDTYFCSTLLISLNHNHILGKKINVLADLANGMNHSMPGSFAVLTKNHVRTQVNSRIINHPLLAFALLP